MDSTSRVSVLITNLAIAVGETEDRRSEWHAQPIGKPFRQEVDPGFAPRPDVGSDIEELMIRNRSRQPLAQAATAPWPHPSHREADQTNEGPAVVEIE